MPEDVPPELLSEIVPVPKMSFILLIVDVLTPVLFAITVLLVEVVVPVLETLYPSSFNLLTTS